MTQNDFLHPLLILPPFIVYLIILVWGFGSLLLVAIKTKTLRTHLVRNPGFMIGDFFLLPAAAALITFFYQSVTSPLPVTTSLTWTQATAILSLIITISLGVKFKKYNKYLIWVWPHGVFHLLFTYLFITFISKGFWQLVFGENSPLLWMIWITAVFAVAIHLILGTIWPKKLPFEPQILN